MDEPRKEELDPEEIEEQNGEPLPDREVMSVINPGDQFLGGPMPDAPDPGHTLPIEPPATE